MTWQGFICGVFSALVALAMIPRAKEQCYQLAPGETLVIEHKK